MANTNLDDATPEPTCAVCEKGKPDIPQLMKCGRCKSISYCSAACQKVDWKTHKSICGKKPGSSSASAPRSASSSSSSSSGPLSPPKGLDQPIAKPFTRLQSRTWLHGRPEADVFRLLIDIYRMRAEDDYKFSGDVTSDSIYGGEVADGRAGLAKMLRRCPRDLLPEWWTEEKAKECVRFGLSGSEEWYSLGSAIEKADVSDHYGDGKFPMQLRMAGEDIYGSGPGGTNKTGMLAMMVAAESGGLAGHTSMHMNMADMFKRR